MADVVCDSKALRDSHKESCVFCWEKKTVIPDLGVPARAFIEG
jgi:hypothetical protein